MSANTNCSSIEESLLSVDGDVEEDCNTDSVSIYIYVFLQLFNNFVMLFLVNFLNFLVHSSEYFIIHCLLFLLVLCYIWIMNEGGS